MRLAIRSPGSSASTEVRSRIAISGFVRAFDIPLFSRGMNRTPSFGSRSARVAVDEDTDDEPPLT